MRSQLCIFAAVLCVLSGSALAQNQPTVPAPVSCAAAQGLKIDPTQLNGTWYEVVRQPSNGQNCVSVDFAWVNQTSLQINTTFSGKTLWQNQTVTSYYNNTVASDINSNPLYAYNITFADQPTVNYTYKFLNFTANSFALICGYTNASNTNTSFGLVLSRTRMLNYTQLNNLTHFNNVNLNFTNFNSTMGNVTQTEQCYYNGAVTMAPVLTAFFALFYAVLKLVN